MIGSFTSVQVNTYLVRAKLRTSGGGGFAPGGENGCRESERSFVSGARHAAPSTDSI